MTRKYTRKIRKGGDITLNTDICTINHIIKGEKFFEDCLRKNDVLDENTLQDFLQRNEKSDYKNENYESVKQWYENYTKNNKNNKNENQETELPTPQPMGMDTNQPAININQQIPITPPQPPVEQKPQVCKKDDYTNIIKINTEKFKNLNDFIKELKNTISIVKDNGKCNKIIITYPGHMPLYITDDSNFQYEKIKDIYKLSKPIFINEEANTGGKRKTSKKQRKHRKK